MRELEKVLKAIADKNRIRIVKLLEKKKMCVCELAHILEITQPSVSRHLKKLRAAGFIESEQDGFWTDYFLKGDNKYAGILLNNLSGWLNDDEVVNADLDGARKAERDTLCSAEK